MKILVYFIISSDNEVDSFNKKNLKRFFKISADINFLVVDNRKIKDKIPLKKYDNLLIYNQKKNKSLIENISIIIKNYNFPFYLRLDPDDDYEPTLVGELSKAIISNDLAVGNYIVRTNKKQFNLNYENGQFDNFEPLGAGIAISRKFLELIFLTCKGLRGQDNFALWILLLTRNYKILYTKNNYVYNQNSNIHGMSKQKKRIIKERLEIIKRIFFERKTFYIINISEKNQKIFEFKIGSKIIYFRFFHFGVIAPLVFLHQNFKFKRINIINFNDDELLRYPSEEIAFCCLTKTSTLIKCAFDRSFYSQKKISMNLKNQIIDMKGVRILGI